MKRLNIESNVVYKKIPYTPYSISRLGIVRNDKEVELLKHNIGEDGEKYIQLKGAFNNYINLNVQNLVRLIYNDKNINIAPAKDQELDQLDLFKLDNPLISEFIEYAIDNNMLAITHKDSVLVENKNFVLFYSVLSKTFQCYYKNCGGLINEKALEDFDDVESLICWYKECQNSQIFQRVIRNYVYNSINN